MALVAFFGFVSIPETKAWFTNTEKSVENIFSAGNLDIELTSHEDNFDPNENLAKGNTSLRTFIVKNLGSTEFIYNLEFVPIPTENDPNFLCQEAILTVNKGTEEVYNGELSDFSLYPQNSFSLKKDQEQEFSFVITIPQTSDHYLGETTCKFSILAKAWMSGYSFETAWQDSDYLENSISTTKWSQFENGEVVINEIMWSGSSAHQNDVWIELRNMTEEDIDLTGWQLVASGPSTHPVTLSGTIPAKGYFLLTNYETDYSNGKKNFAAINDNIKPSLVDTKNELNKNLNLQHSTGEKIILKSPDGKVIDETPEPGTGQNKGWAAGEWNKPDGPYKSMQRLDEPGDGSKETNWISCNHDGCNSNKFWDKSEKGRNYGTPGSPNLYVKTKQIETLNSGQDSVTRDVVAIEQEEILENPLAIPLEIQNNEESQVEPQTSETQNNQDIEPAQEDTDTKEKEVKDVEEEETSTNLQDEGQQVVVTNNDEKRRESSTEKPKDEGDSE